MTAGLAATVWRIDLDDERWDTLPCALNEAERARARQFLARQAATRFRRCRNALRHLLVRHTGGEAAGLVLHSGPFGKPELAGTPLHFNVTHSAGWALVAVGERPMGIDLELAARRDLDVEAIAALACHPDEAAALAAVPDGARRAHSLLTLWTRKEAYVKAVGKGLQIELRSIRLAGADGREVLDASPGALGGYQVAPLEAPSGFIASLCARGPLAAPRYRAASILLQAAAGGDEA